jgi:hypothetical protein
MVMGDTPSPSSDSSLSTRSFGREALVLFAWGTALPLVIFVAGFLKSGESIADFVEHSDAFSYVAVANMVLTGERSPFPWDERVYWGWALLLVPFGALGLNLYYSCIGLGIVMGGLVPVLFHALVRNWRLSLLLAMFPPAWLMADSYGLSEPAYLFFILLSLWLFFSRRIYTSAWAMALAAAVRPTAVFAWMGIAVVLIRRRAWGTLIGWSALCGLGPLLCIGLNQAYYKAWNRQSDLHGKPQNIPLDVIQKVAPDGNTRTYLNVPFKALIETPFVYKVPAWKIAYIYAHVLAVLLASALAIRCAFDGTEWGLVMAVWAILNTLFVVSAGPFWGFQSFDRYCIWALPAYLYVCRSWIPTRYRLIELFGLLSFMLSLWRQTAL